MVDIKSKPKISLKELDNKKYSEELTLVNMNKIINIESGRSSKIENGWTSEQEKRKLVREEFLKMNINHDLNNQNNHE